MAALALTFAACSNDDNDILNPAQTAKGEGITITATLAPKDAGATTRAVSEGTGDDAGDIVASWAVNEHIAILYDKDGAQMADATIKSVDASGTATIEFTVESGTADNTACTLVYPLSAAKDDKTGVKDAATLLASQDGTLNANLDVRVGAGKIKTSTPSLDVTTQPKAQFAIFKFTTKDMAGSSTVNVKPLTITVGADSYVINPSTATSTLYAALPATTNGAVTFNATDGGSKKHFFSKNGVTIEKGKFYQSTIKLISYSTPLTMEALTDGTIVIKSPKVNMQYSQNGGSKMKIYSTDDFPINVSAGDKVAFYGDGTNITAYSGTKITGGTAQVKVYGNIMSLVDESGYETATELSAVKTFDSFFDSNAYLTDASGLLLPATTLTSLCYEYLFVNCVALTAAPALPATSLASYCYQSMFNSCYALTAAPALPAKVLADGCYESIFSGCAALTAAPALPATTLTTRCYFSMFDGCAALTAAPALPAEVLASNCYQNMFRGCTKLTAAPALPATSLTSSCYYSMFEGCAALTAAPALPAIVLANSCYRNMFKGCTKLSSVTCLATNISASNCLKDWLQNAGTEATNPTLYVDASMTGATWNYGSFKVTAKP